MTPPRPRPEPDPAPPVIVDELADAPSEEQLADLPPQTLDGISTSVMIDPDVQAARIAELEAERDSLLVQLQAERDQSQLLENELAAALRKNREAPVLPLADGNEQIPVPTGEGLPEFRGITPGMWVRVLPTLKDADGEPSAFAGHRGVVVEIIEEATKADDGCPFLVDFGGSRSAQSFAFDELAQVAGP